MKETAAYNLGYWGAIIAAGLLAAWVIYALIKYKPFSMFIKMMYDIRWLTLQVVYMYSGSQESIFSLKRFHVGLITYWCLGTASLVIHRTKDISATNLMIILTPFIGKLVYDGYEIRKDKQMNAEKEQSAPKDDEQKTN